MYLRGKDFAVDECITRWRVIDRTSGLYYGQIKALDLGPQSSNSKKLQSMLLKK